MGYELKWAPRNVFPIKGPLSSDLKSKDNVYITTARESYEIQGRSVGSLDVCSAELQLSAVRKYTCTFSENHFSSYTVSIYHQT